MTAQELGHVEHTHACRDCGTGFGCSATDTPAGCPEFDGLCPECSTGDPFAEVARVGGLLIMSDTFPGSWGWGETETAALERWKANGGRGARLVLTIDPYWSGAYVDAMGTVGATLTDPSNVDVPRRDRPPVITHGERVSTNGRRSILDLDA